MILINGFLIDAAPVETHSLNSVTTEHPVEEGADVTDHIRISPDMLTIEGLVSNTPIGEVAVVRENESPFLTEVTGGVVTADTPLRGVPSDDAFAFLKAIRAKREPVEVITNIATYRNMVMIGLSVPQDSTDALRFRATFQEIQIVKTDRTAVPVEIPRAQKKSKRGKKSSEVVKESKLLERQRQFMNKSRKNWGQTHNPSLGTDLL